MITTLSGCTPSLGMWYWLWVPKAREYMKGRFPAKSPDQLKITDEMIRILHRSYLAELANGAKRYTFVSMPGKDFSGLPDKSTSSLIVRIGKSTGYGTLMSGVFADAMIWLFQRGDIGQDEFDPATKISEKQTTEQAFPKEPGAASGLINAVTGGIKTSAIALPVVLGVAGVLLVLMYIPRPRS